MCRARRASRSRASRRSRSSRARTSRSSSGRAFPGGSVRPSAIADLGSLAPIGRQSAVVQFGRLRLSGYFAWWLWGVAHIFFLIGFRNRIAVAISWLWSYFTFQRGTRLITGADPEPEPGPAAKPLANPLTGAA